MTATRTALDQVMAGCTILLTGERRSSELATALERRGAAVVTAPAMSIRPDVDEVELAAQTRELIARPPDVVVVTTGIGFRAWVEAADAWGLADDLLAALGSARIVARGPKARGAIQATGLTTDWVAESEVAAEVADHLLSEGVDGLRIAVQHHGAGADGLDGAFAQAGADVVSLIVYRWGPPTDPDAVIDGIRRVAEGDIDAVVFTSAPAAAAWFAEADRIGLERAVVEGFRSGRVVAAAVGPVTAGPLLQRRILPLQPERGRLGALVRTLVDHYSAVQTYALQTVGGQLQIRSRLAVLDGEVLPLSPSGLEVLRLLAAAGGDVVTRAEVLEVLPGESRDPHAAEVAIARLREVAGRDLIRTVVKRGYRLMLT